MIKKKKLSIAILEVSARTDGVGLDEEKIRNLFAIFKELVVTKNLPECKKFIHNYVKQVVFDVKRPECGYLFILSIKKKALFEACRYLVS